MMIAAAFPRLANRLLVKDPGLVRLQTALRVVTACLLSGAAGLCVAHFMHARATVAALAILFSMVAPLFVRDARRGDWYVSLLAIYLVSCTCFAAAAALSAWPVAGDALFLLVLGVGMLCQTCGLRAVGCALAGVINCYLGLYLHPSPTQAAPMLALSLLGLAMVVFTARVLVPMRRGAALRLAVHTVLLRAAAVLTVQAEHAPPPARTAARVAALNEAALALEEQLALLAPEHAGALRERLVEVEIAAGQYTFDAVPGTTNRLALRQVLRQAIARLESCARRCADSPAALHRPRPPLLRRIAALRSRLAWLPAARATTAALLAMLIGQSVSPERWFWAVITTFVVFLGTRSRADTMYRCAERVAGTLVGALVSLLIVTGLHQQPGLLAIVMLACVFGWAYTVMSSYAWGVFFITVLVGLVYGELGFAIRPLVEMRIEEVLLGCVVALAVAVVMMPLETGRHIEARLAAALAALREVVRQAVPLASEPASQGAVASPSPAAAHAMRALDRSWHDLRMALRPLTTQRVFVWSPGYELAAGALLCCLHWARALSRDTGAVPPDPVHTRTSDPAALAHYHAASLLRRDSIMTRLDGLLIRYGAPAAATPPAPAGQPAPHLALSHELDPAAAMALIQLDAAVAQLAERLNQPRQRARLHLRAILQLAK